MSILLEALRKSEKDQREPKVPDIHADDESSRLPDAIQTGPLAVLLVLALFASGWFVWNQYQAPAVDNQPSMTPAAGEVATLTQPIKNQQKTDQAATAKRDSRDQQPDLNVENPAERTRTPVESYQEATDNISRAGSGSAKMAAANTQDQAVNQLAGQKGNRPAATENTDSKQLAEGKKQAPRHELAPISYWELPDAIRADVPEIRFSVLVYSKQPGERFVLINGRRLAQGDSVQAGLVVKEIRRDGVVFSYRLYQFLVER